MEPLPEPIWQFLQGWMQRRFVFAYILVDHEGKVCSWGGDLGKLGLPALKTGQPVTDSLLFAEGLFPMQVPSLYLPMVKMDADKSLDIHLFRIQSGYGLFLVDATGHEKDIATWQQKANELACEAEKNTRFAHSADDLYYALDIVAMQRNDDRTFDLLGRAPEWLTRYCPETADGHAKCIMADCSFSFLENFLLEADSFWERNTVGSIKSGIWIETESGGNEHYFEAIAVTTSLDRILLITRDLSYFDETRRIIQTGREIATEKDALQSRQKQLIASQSALEEQVQQRTRQLQQANARLADELAWRQQIEEERTAIMRQLQQAQKMEAIGTLAGGIAHDFNNILSAILGFTELSLNEVEDNSTLRNNLNYVLNAADRAKDLIRQILTFSRQSKSEIKPVQPKTVVEEGLKLLRASLPAAIDIQQELESEAYVLADPIQIHQVIINLCTNAAHAMRKNGGVLSVRLTGLELLPVDMAAYPELHPGAYVELTVRDSGHGMTDEVLQKLFEPFFTTKEEGQGTGMGLAVVHGIVRSCHGAVFVTSRPGVGSIFRVLLPVITSFNPEKPHKISTIQGGNESILFIDDEPMQVELAMQVLGRMGYRVVATTDCLQAISTFTADSESFDLIISDINMPRMNGWSLTRKLRQIRANVPIILCSGYYSNEQDRPADLQVQGFLKKPVPMAEMSREIRRVLDR